MLLNKMIKKFFLLTVFSSSRILQVTPAVETYQIKAKPSQSRGDKARNLEEDRTVY